MPLTCPLRFCSAACEHGPLSCASPWSAIGAIWLNHEAPLVVIGQLQQTLPDDRISLFGERPHSPRSLFAKVVVHGVPLKSQQDSAS
ncbi:hypothetical protein [Bradyrhizobium sp. BRP56]|uniref:hypothetical protein n=1 Tax=Bradyrhizobium sp. BRP56 TaxID=2793819 RepID=UPI001CD563A4|nr:hypothetical protein [Bradyrhizobium sp. BRP56]MCA1399528.1 hypothetical protein [Bradyrhizobium sp. BRP56]